MGRFVSLRSKGRLKNYALLLCFCVIIYLVRYSMKQHSQNPDNIVREDMFDDSEESDRFDQNQDLDMIDVHQDADKLDVPQDPDLAPMNGIGSTMEADTEHNGRFSTKAY